MVMPAILARRGFGIIGFLVETWIWHYQFSVDNEMLVS